MSEPNQTTGLDTVRGDVSDALSEILEFSDALARLMEGDRTRMPISLNEIQTLWLIQVLEQFNDRLAVLEHQKWRLVLEQGIRDLSAKLNEIAAGEPPTESDTTPTPENTG